MRTALFAVVVLLAACGSKKTGDSSTGSGSDTGSAMMTGSGSGSGSSMAAGSGSGSGSGSAMAAGSGSDAGSGSGSAMAAGSGSGSDTGSGSAAAGSGSGSDATAVTPFDKLDRDAKLALMKKVVMPAMREAFHKFDPKKYEKVTCKTCHGKDPEGSKYKMPNPDLPQLDFAALKAGKQKPETAKFMGEVVNPQMAKMLGLPEYTEKNPTGFGCLACHTQKK